MPSDKPEKFMSKHRGGNDLIRMFEVLTEVPNTTKYLIKM